jgi:pimeloyl-ACP methyl ester carboxylesterase
VSRGLVRIVSLAALGTVLIVALALGWLKIHEDDIVFATQRSRQHLLSELPADAQRVSVPGASGTALAGLVFRADGGAENSFWVLHLHGNADSAFSAWQVRHSEALRRAGFSVLEIDYRGFGATPGQASETHMYEDSEAAYQELLRRGVAPDHIILLGHSLGSGPAVLLATQHAAAALVLFGAFTSIPDAAAGRYPYLPVRLAVGVQFDSLSRIGHVHIPVVIAHSRTDAVIPYAHALKLFAAANQPKHLITFDSASDDRFGGHVDSLYEHVDILRSALVGLVPAIATP